MARRDDCALPSRQRRVKLNRYVMGAGMLRMLNLPSKSAHSFYEREWRLLELSTWICYPRGLIVCPVCD